MAKEKDAYANAGVDIDEGERFVEMVKERIANTWPGEERNIGGFAGAVPVPRNSKQGIYSTDGVGTKLSLAATVEVFSGVGIDAVAMSAVDSFVAGVRPSYILDYFATGKLDSKKHIAIIDSLIEGCKMAGCKLIGGETAEMPRFFRQDWFIDLITFAAGFDNDPIKFSPIKVGQRVFALPSYGLGSNGFSLARKACNLICSPSQMRRKLQSSKTFGSPLHATLLRPTPIWINPINEELERGVKLSGMVHVTGGGPKDNPPRILPSEMKMVIDRSAWDRPEVFRYIQDVENVPVPEMDRAFNNGVMMLLILDNDSPSFDDTVAPFVEVGVIEKRNGDEHQSELVGTYSD